MKRPSLFFKLIFVSIFSLIILSANILNGGAINSFDFTLKDGTVHNIIEYTDKPILLEWGASWCVACEANLKAMNEIHHLYKDKVNFISLSFGGSGDDLDDLSTGAFEGIYDWPIGLDTSNKAADLSVANGQLMFLKPDLSLYQIWTYTVIISQEQKDQLKTTLNELIVESEGIESATETKNAGTQEEQLTNASGFESITILSTFVIIGVGLITLRRKRI